MVNLNSAPRFLYFLDKDVTSSENRQQVQTLGLAFIFAYCTEFVLAGNIYSFLDSGISEILSSYRSFSHYGIEKRQWRLILANQVAVILIIIIITILQISLPQRDTFCRVFFLFFFSK